MRRLMTRAGNAQFLAGTVRCFTPLDEPTALEPSDGVTDVLHAWGKSPTRLGELLDDVGPVQGLLGIGDGLEDRRPKAMDSDLRLGPHRTHRTSPP